MREMKNSGVEWIGEIPAEWQLPKVKNLFSIGRGRVISQLELEETGYPVYSSQTKKNGCLGYISTYDFDRSQLTWTTDGANAGTVFLREGKHNCTNVCGTLMLKNQDNNLKYLKYALEFIAIYHKRADINGYKIMNNEMAEIVITLPSKREQDEIAILLESKCSEIDVIIEKTKTTIEEYKSLKQSIITESVTKGVRGNRLMKDSGIEWIGKIPAEWGIEKGKHILVRLERSVKEDDGVITCFRDGEVTLRSNRREDGFTFAIQETGYQGIEPNDLVIHGMDGFAGAIGVSDSRGKGTPVLNVLDSAENKRYIMYYLRSMAYNGVFISLATGIRVRSCDTNWNKLKELPYPLPSRVEQNEIVAYIDDKVEKINTLIFQKVALLEELENYKKSVIYEYVTGKKEGTSVIQSTSINIIYPYFPAVLYTTKPRFAQAVLMSRVLDKCRKGMGRVKLEKMMFIIENSVGFDFDTEYVREAAGPLDGSIYECETIISRNNKWFFINESKYGVSYKPTQSKTKYEQYYNKYFADYDNEIEHIIDVFKDYTTDQAEIVATLFGVWNDFIIDQKQFTDEDIVDEVLNNWNDSKKRFPKDVWLRTISEMRNKNIIPKGYGKHTIIKLEKGDL